MNDPKQLAAALCRAESDDPATRPAFRKGAKTAIYALTNDLAFAESVMQQFDSIYRDKAACRDDIELSPGNPDQCLGNGETPTEDGFTVYECCCDECDHYLACFPDAINPAR